MKMKLVLMVMPLFLCIDLMAQSSIYDLKVETYKNQQINLSSLKGKKILIAAMSISNLQNGKMDFLDSLQVKNGNVKVITIPVADSTDIVDSEKVTIAAKNVKSVMTITRANKVKKSDGNEQDPLMKWLTDVNENNHFNAEVRTDEQYYLVSRYGVLYAVLEKGVPISVINDLLNDADLRDYPFIN